MTDTVPTNPSHTGSVHSATTPTESISYDKLDSLSDSFFDTRAYYPEPELELDDDGLPVVLGSH